MREKIFSTHEEDILFSLYLYGWSLSRIATLMDVSISTVYRSVLRAQERAKAFFKKKGIEYPFHRRLKRL